MTAWRVGPAITSSEFPDFSSVFELAIDALTRTQLVEKHLIVISDGDPSPPSPALLARFRRQKALVHTVCVMPHDGPRGPSVDVMRRIATLTGGQFVYAETTPALILAARAPLLSGGEDATDEDR